MKKHFETYQQPGKATFLSKKLSGNNNHNGFKNKIRNRSNYSQVPYPSNEKYSYSSSKFTKKMITSFRPKDHTAKYIGFTTIKQKFVFLRT